MVALKLKENRIINVKIAKRIVFGLCFVLFFEFLMFPAPVLASEGELGKIEQNLNITQEAGQITDVAAFENSLPENDNLQISWETYRSITAYNSEVGQTDSSPCVTANGFNVCKHGLEDTIAANWLKFGTKVRIPEIFGDRIFVVRDRMNKRFPDKVDIWMQDKADAKHFGLKIAKIEVLEEP
jgi:3D (Asp-Asp-Asp) domain-containing protein